MQPNAGHPLGALLHVLREGPQQQEGSVIYVAFYFSLLDLGKEKNHPPIRYFKMQRYVRKCVLETFYSLLRADKWPLFGRFYSPWYRESERSLRTL